MGVDTGNISASQVPSAAVVIFSCCYVMYDLVLEGSFQLYSEGLPKAIFHMFQGIQAMLFLLQQKETSAVGK